MSENFLDCRTYLSIEQWTEYVFRADSRPTGSYLQTGLEEVAGMARTWILNLLAVTLSSNSGNGKVQTVGKIKIAVAHS